MTLEDFFTLTEMKDGLTVPARVEELVAVMKKEKDCVVKNVGDATRQWSTVASVIAVTDNKDCLDLFIQLDGLWFIERWLKDAQTFSADANDYFVEESISALLEALEKLKIGIDKLTSSGICLIVKDLLSHKSNNIQDKAKALLGNLKPSSVNGAVKLDSEDVQAVCDDRIEPGNRLAGESGDTTCSAADTSDQKADIDQHLYQPVRDDAASTGCRGDGQSEGPALAAKEPDKLASRYSESDHKEVEVKVESSVREETCPSEGKLANPSPKQEQGTCVRKEGIRLECFSEIVNAEIHNESLPDKLAKVEISPASVTPKPVEVSSTLVKDDASECDRKTVLCTGNHVDSLTMKNMSADEHLPMVGTCTGPDDNGVLRSCTVKLEHKASGQGNESCTKTLPDSNADGSILGKPDDLERTYPQNDNLRSVDEVGEQAKHDPNHSRDSCGFEPSRGSKSVNLTSKTSAMDIEYGTVDALEVACLVAKEVERQVVEDEQQSGIFSGRSLRGGNQHLADTLDSFHGKKDQLTEGDPSNESPIVEKMSVEGSPKEDKPSTSSEYVERQHGNRYTESSQVTEGAPESSANADKGTSGFDLNLEICSEDAANSVLDPSSVISSSKAVATPGLLASPSQFKGSPGWKVSASNNAFQPEFPHRSSGGGRTTLVEEATSASTQRQDFVIDLNIAEEGNDKTMNPVLPGHSSGESLPEPRRSDKLSFDLNEMTEDGDAPPSDWKSFGAKTAHYSSSPASTSSSQRLAMRGFDLNDRPSNFNYSSDLQPYLGISSSHKVNTYEASSDDSVISIMGAKVKKKTFPHPVPVSFLNVGRVSESDANLAMAGPLLAAGGAAQYAPPAVYSYNGTAVGPTVSFSSPMYGPGGSVAYMFDSRGVPLVPQLIEAPPSTLQAPFAQHPSFAAAMASPLLGPNEPGPLRPNLGLNSGFLVEGVNRDAGGLRQLLVPGQVRSAEEHLHPFFPGILGGKRKEPDGGWDPYLNNYKHHQQPHL